jgi:hypothetical protein
MADKIIAQYDIETNAFKAKIKTDVIDSYKKAEKAGVDSAQKVSTAYNKAGGSAKGLGSHIGGLKQQFSGLGAGISQIGAAMGVAFGVQQVISFGKASAAAFIDAEKNAQLLLFALKGNEAAQNRLMAQASNIQEDTIFDDDSVQQAQTFLATQGRTEAQIKKVIDAAVELSTVTGVDLQTAVMQLDGTFEGNIGKLAKLDSAFKRLTPEQLANGEAADILIQKYGGVAKAMGDTTAGQVEKLKNQIGELQESMGGEMLPILNQLVEGLNKLTNGEIFGGLDGISGAFEKMTVIAQLFGPIAGVTDAFNSLKGALKDFQDGNILEGIAQGYEAIANVISMGLYDAIKDQLLPGVKESIDSLTDFEKQQFAVIAATKEQIDAERERVKAIGGSVEAYDKWVDDVLQAQITRTFEQLNDVLDITEKQYERLTDISDKYNASARISADLIMDIRTATEQDLEVAFQKFNSTLGVTRKDFDDYIGQVKELKPLQEDLGKSTEKLVGPYDALTKAVGAAMKQLQDMATLFEKGSMGWDIVIDKAQKYADLQNELTEVNRLTTEALKRQTKEALIPLGDAMDIVIAKDRIMRETFEFTDEQIKQRDEIFKTAGVNQVNAYEETLKQIAVLREAELKANIGDLEKQQEIITKYTAAITNLQLQQVASMSGALAQLGTELSNALSQIFGKAAEDNALFAAFQKAITISIIGFKSAEAIANGIAKIAAGDPLSFVQGLTSIIAGIGSAIGGLMQEVNSTAVPQPPSFFHGTGYVERGNNPKGIDTIPAYLNEGEGVVTTEANAKYTGVVNMMNRGSLDKYILTQWVAPALQAQEKQMQKDFADNLASSMLLQSGSNFDDMRMVSTMKEVALISKYGFKMIDKSIKGNKNPWSC